MVSPWWWRNTRAHLAAESLALIILVSAGFAFWVQDRPISQKDAFTTATTAIEARYRAASTGRRSDWEALHVLLTDQARDTIEQLPPTDMAAVPVVYHPFQQKLIQSSPGSAVVQTDGSIDVRLPGTATHTDLVRELVVLKREGAFIKVAAWNYLGAPPAELHLTPADR